MKRFVFFLFWIGLFVAGFAAGQWTVFQRGSSLALQGFSLYPLIITLQTGDTIDFEVAIADTSDKRTHGLQGLSELPSDEGMWFVFDDAASRRFWMKDMLFALDILFANEDFEIVGFAENVPPCSEEDPTQEQCSTYSSAQPVRYVLELPAGSVALKQIQLGDLITSFPSF